MIRRPPRSTLFPTRRSSDLPAPWARAAPLLRIAAVAGLCWGLVTLLVAPPKVHVAEAIPENQRRNILLVLEDRKSTRLNSSHANISYAVFCLKKKKIS